MAALPLSAWDKSAIEKLPPIERGEQRYKDPDTPGLIIRVRPGGKSFYWYRWVKGKSKLIHLGNFPETTPGKARLRAKKLNNGLSAGLDETLGISKVSTGITCEKMVERYLAEYVPVHLRSVHSQKDYRRALENDFLPECGDRLIHRITKADINRVVNTISLRGSKGRATKVLAVMSSMFAWAMNDMGWIDQNPCAGMKRPAPIGTRHSNLDETDIAAIWQDADKLPGFWPMVLRLTILTLVRRSVFPMSRWSQFNGETFTMPEGVVKGADHRIPLSDLAIEQMQALKEVTGASEWMCPSSRAAWQKPVGPSAFTNVLKRAHRNDAFRVKDWTLHDFRDVPTLLTDEYDVDPVATSVMLTHSLKGVIPGVTAKHYNRAAMMKQKLEGFQVWADVIKTLVEKTR